jgi:hypothetical protein
MKSKLKLTTIALGLAVLALPAAALASPTRSMTQAPRFGLNAATSDLQIPLTPSKAFPKATGSSQYQSQPAQREFQVEVQHLRSLAGQSVLVQVNGKNVGWAKVSSAGIAQLSRNTELGQNVPRVVHGSTVTVKTNTVISSGVF